MLLLEHMSPGTCEFESMSADEWNQFGFKIQSSSLLILDGFRACGVAAAVATAWGVQAGRLLVAGWLSTWTRSEESMNWEWRARAGCKAFLAVYLLTSFWKTKSAYQPRVQEYLDFSVVSIRYLDVWMQLRSRLLWAECHLSFLFVKGHCRFLVTNESKLCL